MRRVSIGILLLLLALWSDMSWAKDLGPIVRANCSAIAGDYGSGDAGKVVCHDLTLNDDLIWDGTAFRTKVKPPSSTTAGLPATCQDGELRRVTDGERGMRRCLSNAWIKTARVNVMDFGAKPNDLTFDQTSVFHACRDAFGSNFGGVCEVPSGKYALNLMLNKQNVRFAGTGGEIADNPNNTNALVPWDVNTPVVTSGDDTSQNVALGAGLSNLNLNCVGPNGTGKYGLKLGGGSYMQDFDHVSIPAGCTKRHFWQESGTYPSSFINIHNLMIQPTNSLSGYEAAIYQAEGSSYTTATYFHGLKLHGPVGNGYMVDLHGDVWFQASDSWLENSDDGHGIRIIGTSNGYGRVVGSMLQIDGAQAVGNGVQLELAQGTAGSPPTKHYSDYVNGLVSFSGKVKWADASLVTLSYGYFSAPSDSTLLYPQIKGDMNFVTDTNPHATSETISADTSSRLILHSASTMRLLPSNGAAHGSVEAGFGAGTFTGAEFHFGAATTPGSNSTSSLLLHSTGNYLAWRDGSGALYYLSKSLRDNGSFVQVGPGTATSNGQASELTTTSTDTSRRSFSAQFDNGDGNGMRDAFVVENRSGPTDIDFRWGVVNFGCIDASTCGNFQTQIVMEQPATAPYGQFITLMAPGEHAANAMWRVDSNGANTWGCGGLASICLHLKARNDANDKFSISETGALAWGAGGGNATDTTLYRSGSGTLKTDTDFVARSVTVPNNTGSYYALGTGGAGTGMGLGMTSADNLSLTNNVSGKAVIITQAGAGEISFDVNGARKADVSTKGLHLGDGSAPFLLSGSGSPEGAVTAIVGSVYSRTNGGTSTTLYVKESGSGNTGWVAYGAPGGGGGGTATAAQPTVTTVNAGNAPYTALATDWKLICDTTAAGRTINLPAASTSQYYKIKVHGANTCTIHPNGSDTIEGVNANYTITLNNASIDLTSDGSAGWDIQ